MPRYLQRKASVAKRSSTPDRWRLSRTWTWVDPFPEVHGTLPEKMVYAELSRLGIPFLFLNDLRFQIPEIELDKYYQADFVIPSLKLIIEVQGAYWHSKEKTIEADAFKFAVYELVGYKVLAWWDYDIISRLHELIISEPALNYKTMNQQFGRSSELPAERRTKVDTSKGIRTLNARRKTGNIIRTRRNTVRKAINR